MYNHLLSLQSQCKAFFVPERDYVRLVQYMVHRYGSGGLPRPTYRETAELLSQEVG